MVSLIDCEPTETCLKIYLEYIFRLDRFLGDVKINSTTTVPNCEYNEITSYADGIRAFGHATLNIGDNNSCTYSAKVQCTATSTSTSRPYLKYLSSTSNVPKSRTRAWPYCSLCTCRPCTALANEHDFTKINHRWMYASQVKDPNKDMSHLALS